MPRKLMVCVLGATIVASMSALTGVASAAGSLTGAGSTLVQPLVAQWNGNSGVNITYSGVGSGTGITDISNRTVDFGASDAPLTSAQAAACHGCVQIPWALTATGVTFHINNIHTLHLSGPVIAKIYLGQIKNWDSKSIQKLNKHTHLPNLAITPVFRSDGSGDTYAFTNYLSKVSGAWKSRVGFATTVSFPTGVGAAHNSGMTAQVEATNGSIGYVAASYLIAQHLPAAALQNAAGKYEYPNLKNIANAGSSITKVPSNNALHIVDPGKQFKLAYPLSTFTYAIVPTTDTNNSTTAALIRYAVGAGQRFGPSLDFSPIPKVVKNAALKTVKSLKNG